MAGRLRDPKCASIGFAHGAQVGVKRNVTLYFFARPRLSAPLWAGWLSSMT